MNRISLAVNRGIRQVTSSKTVHSPPVILYVGNLPWTCSRRELREYFKKFGDIRACKVAFNYETGLSRGYGFVCFKDSSIADTVVKKQDHQIDNAFLNVSKSFSSNLRNFNSDFTAK